MVGQKSAEMLAFNFASRSIAHRRLAKTLSRSVSAFSSFMREYLDPVVKADQSPQDMHDIGIVDNNAKDLIRNVRAVFQKHSQSRSETDNRNVPFWSQIS